MEELQKLLVDYKNCSLDILKCLEDEELDILNNQIDKRLDIIEKIKSLNYSNDEFIRYCNELDIKKLENEIEVKIGKKRLELLDKMKNMSTAHDANNSYNKMFNVAPYFFNKKI